MEPQNQPPKSGSIMTAVVTLIIIAAVIVAIVVYKMKSSSQPAAVQPATTATTTDATEPGVVTTTTTTTTSTSTSPYKDGTYTAQGSYESPEGPDTIAVTLVLKNGVITDANVVAQATRPTSQHYQGIFVANYKSYVIGKNIADLNLTKVAGSSLTPGGFDDALAKIKAQATA